MAMPNKVLENPELSRQFMEMWNAGKTVFRISIETGLSHRAIMRAVRELNLTPREITIPFRVEKWTDEMITEMRILWDAGVSTQKIAEHLGFGLSGKNSVIGKIHRLNWPKRPSPIRKKADADSPAPAPAPKVERPIYVEQLKQIPMPFLFKPHRSVQIAPKKQEAPKTPEPRINRKLLADGPTTDWPVPGKCQFPHNSKFPWEFCGNVAPLGDVWCKKHRSIVYVKTRDMENINA